MVFVNFSEPTPLDEKRFWTAEFESYDQRNDDVYYVISLHEGGEVIACYMAQVGVWWGGDHLATSEVASRLKRELHILAAGGKTNTGYEGSLASWLGWGGC